MSLRIASLTLLVLAAAGLYELLPRLRRARLPTALRHAPAAWVFVAFVAVLLLWAPVVYVRSPAPAEAKTELTGLLTGVLLAAGTVAATRGSPHGLRGLRLGWTLGLGLVLVTAAVELATGLRVHADESLTWALDPTVVAGPFRNPNDFAAILTVLVSGVIAYRATLRGRILRAGLAVMALLGVVAVLLTQSRGGLIAITLVLAIHGIRAALDGRAALLSRSRPLPAQRCPASSAAVSGGSPSAAGGTRHRRIVTRLFVAATVVVAAVAAFTVPALVRLNPIAATIAAAGQPGTARSDTLRLDLIRAGWRYFTESDRLGTGAGSFEHLLANDPDPGVSHIIWMHNSFLEFLLQYGVVVAGALVAVIAAVLATVAWGARPRPLARPARSAQPAPTTASARRLVTAEVLSALVAFAALGTLAYTALETHVWWMMLAQAVAGAWWLAHADVKAADRASEPSAGEVAGREATQEMRSPAGSPRSPM